MTRRQATGRDSSTIAASAQGLALTVPAYFVQPRRLIKDLKCVLPAGTDAGFGHGRSDDRPTCSSTGALT